ncbi:hypothetical protein PGTUg99_008597 [Puccinia graminis f. sp. tritici]|uniref:Uncharacterized protein n=1 Tax=Puccinia graminis f. sp. tritici TaxID=56615 RepID=A0A5B0RX60_PUCGR|nr:hypothetical protein PGTUg99_008597 [Puccinia graminis f. sp. tritici]
MLLLLILAGDLKHLLHSNLADNLKQETLRKTAEVKKPLQKSANVMMGDSETSSMEHAPSHKGHGHGPEATPSAPCTPKTASRRHNYPLSVAMPSWPHPDQSFSWRPSRPWPHISLQGRMPLGPNQNPGTAAAPFQVGKRANSQRAPSIACILRLHGAFRSKA